MICHCRPGKESRALLGMLLVGSVRAMPRADSCRGQKLQTNMRPAGKVANAMF